MKSLTDKQNLRELSTNKTALQQMLKVPLIEKTFNANGNQKKAKGAILK